MASRPIVVMGVSGAGKSSVAAALADLIDGGVYVDADDLHPASNVAKMSAGVPLDDVDRAPWLTLVGRQLARIHAEGRTPVMACSALKRAYRQRILDEEPEAYFVLLEVARDELERRMHARSGHFMPSSLLDSQLAALEPLQGNEPGVTLPVQGGVAAVAALALEAVLATE